MKLFCLFLLAAGWFLVIAAVALLRPGFIGVFAAAGVGVELLGLLLLARQHGIEAARATRSLAAGTLEPRP